MKKEDLEKKIDINQLLTTFKDECHHIHGDENDFFHRLAEALKEPQIQAYVQYLVRCQIDQKALSDDEYQNVMLLVYLLQVLYNQSGEENVVSDYDYDRIYELLERYGEEMISTENIRKGVVYNHKYTSLRGTLKKIYALEDEEVANESRRGLKEWVKSAETIIFNKTGKKVDLWEEEIYVFPKWDGVSVTFEFDERNKLDRALLRGDTEANEAKDVTFAFTVNASRIRDLKMTGKPYGLKTEVMMRTNDLEAYNKRFGKKYKTTRSVVSSILNTDTLDGRENLLEVIRLRTSVLNEDGTEQLQELATNAFERPYIRCRLKDVDKIRKFAEKHRFVDGLRCDGAVIYLINKELRTILGRVKNKNEYEVAYKFNEDVAYTKIIDVEYNPTVTGRIFPRAVFKPLNMKGVTVQDASLGSIARARQLKLAKGDKVKILYEITPYLAWDPEDPKCKRSGNPPIEPPDNCPECGEPLEMNRNETIYYCINPNCPCKQRGKILNYVEKIGLKGIGEATIKDFYEAGYLSSILDLYKLKEVRNQLVELPRYEETSVDNIIKEIESHRYLSASTLLGAIGIECAGKSTFDKIFSFYEVDDLIEFAEDMKVSKLILINGIADIMAKRILDGINENKKLIKKLLKIIQIYYDLNSDEDVKFIAVFHKIRSKLVTEMIEKCGGKVKDDITTATKFLIIPDGFEEETGPIKKAKRWNVDIVEISKVEEYLRNLVRSNQS